MEKRTSTQPGPDMDSSAGSDVARLCDIYRELDTESQKIMVAAAVNLFSVQKTLETRQMSRASHFAGFAGYFITVFLLSLAAGIFWVTLIKPALLMAGITPALMVRIIISALCGLLVIGAGFMRFMQRKLLIHWMLLAICAGILCVDSRALTDFAGIVILALIVAVQLIGMKRGKTAFIIR